MKYCLLLVLFCYSFISFAAGRPVSVNSDRDTSSTRSLKQALPFPIGVALKINLLKNNATYRNLVAREFNSVTAENAMKFHALHPSQNVFKWDEADYLVNFARKNNIRVHAQTLIWPKSTPRWLLEFQGDKEAWRQLFKTHIQTVVSHFKGQVAAWDVVNEAFDDKGGLKKTVWLTKLGPDYIALAFQYAHEADPGALLFYNDYGHEYGGKKLQTIIKMANDFKRRGVPIDGIGMQMHVPLRINVSSVKRNLLLAAKTGLAIHISELDIRVRYQKPNEFTLDSALADAQGEKYRAIVQAYLTLPKKQQYGITLWGVGDRDSYWNSKSKSKMHDYPMLFDHFYKPKPAYFDMIKAVTEK